MNRRRLIVAANFICAAVLAVPCAAQATTAPNPSGGLVVGAALVVAPNGAYAGKPSVLRGSVPTRGAVSVQFKLADGTWQAIGEVTPNSIGAFELQWTPPAKGVYELRATPTGASVASANTAATTELGPLSVYSLQKTTWYGPGFYGERTACGVKLTRRTLGVAHKTLPCGTLVEFYRAGEKVTVPVIDRGPYARGVSWDLTLPAARAIGMLGSERVGVLPIR
ncbi:MAG: hypothetical protein JHC87_03125 [Thermoleophilaceae bacterium]|nr:hypothetical protein [Thermoleophilaceae bacterium]